VQPPTRIDDRIVVPIHIDGLEVDVSFDTANAEARAEASMSYRVGPWGGYPVFDLRQTVDQCWIDDVRFDPEVLQTWNAGHPDPWSSVRFIDRHQGAGSAHRLRLRYRLTEPAADLGGAYPPVLKFDPGRRVRWSAAMADLYAGRYLEAWFPANLPFDHFPFRLQIDVAGTPIPHIFITNGRVTTLGQNRWSVGFPDWFTSMSPLLELHPADQVDVASRVVELPASVKPVVVSVWKFATSPDELAPALNQITTLLSSYERQYGPFGGDHYACFLHSARGGMEYAHATTSSVGALRHEVLHAWFARGVTPASQADGWWDEGFIRYTEQGAEAVVPLDFDSPPVQLCSRRPWQRFTPVASYAAGSRLFGGLAAVLGPTQLAGAMRALYLEHCNRSVDTAMLESHLLAVSGELTVVDAFHRFVYGFEDPARSPVLRINSAGVTGNARSANRRLVARVGSDPQHGHCPHFAVLFALRARSKPVVTVAAVGFDLAPGAEQTISAAWPSELDNADPTKYTLSASIYTRGLSADASARW
jgi:hypothetical protein